MRACPSYLGTGRALGPTLTLDHPVTTHIRVGSVPRSRRFFFPTTLSSLSVISPWGLHTNRVAPTASSTTYDVGHHVAYGWLLNSTLISHLGQGCVYAGVSRCIWEDDTPLTQHHLVHGPMHESFRGSVRPTRDLGSWQSAEEQATRSSSSSSSSSSQRPDDDRQQQQPPCAACVRRRRRRSSPAYSSSPGRPVPSLIDKEATFRPGSGDIEPYRIPSNFDA